VITLVIGVVLAAVYVLSVIAYGAGLSEEFTAPSPPEDGVAVALLPIRVDADARMKATSLKDSGEITATSAEPLPLNLHVSFKVPGWRFTDNSPPQVGQTAAIATGVIERSVPIIAIAVIFIILILMMGVLAVLTVVAGVRGRADLGISQAAWLTSAIFALIALRNAFPGSPPLGSWLDILVYFWVITAIMLMIGLAVVTNLIRQARKDD
jgi:hypothetical protein